jgi:hypothetical protein
MIRRTRLARLILASAVLGALAFGTVASTQAGGPKIIDSGMSGIPVGGMVLEGVIGGGAPWQISQGDVKLFADGRLHVEVHGLLLLNGTNPIRNGRAIVACGGAAAASSPIVPFSETGDAEVDTRVSLPSPCLAPVVFFAGVLPNGLERWFAVGSI